MKLPGTDLGCQAGEVGQKKVRKWAGEGKKVGKRRQGSGQEKARKWAGEGSSGRRSEAEHKERQEEEGEELKRGCRSGQIRAAGSAKLTAGGWEMQN